MKAVSSLALSARATLSSIRRACGVFLMAVGAVFMSSSEGKAVDPNSTFPEFTLEKNGRDFDRISIHPNSEEWLFTECSRALNAKGDCHVLRYNINTKQLQRYVLPDGYLYGYASFSPRGHYIVMSRSFKHDGSEEKIRQSFDNAEIVMMRSDGTDLRALPLPKGSKLAPFMSNDETKIAYWRPSAQWQPGSKGGLDDFEVREYDLKTKQDSLFAGPYRFIEGGNAQYASENEILLRSYAPRQYVQSLSAYEKKFNGSQVYRLSRGAADLPNPSFTSINRANNPSIDQEGNAYLEGQPPKVGFAFIRITPAGQTTIWREPRLGTSGLRHVIAAPNGQYIAFIYAAEGTRYSDRKSAMGRLDIASSRWLPLSIPALQSSTSIAVKTAAE